MFKLVPRPGHISVVPLKTSEVKQYTGKQLSDVETPGMDILQYGRVMTTDSSEDHACVFKSGDIILYPRLASDKTNFGDPRQVIVEVGHVKAYLQEEK